MQRTRVFSLFVSFAVNLRAGECNYFITALLAEDTVECTALGVFHMMRLKAHHVRRAR
jgi:hypothetical protein